MSVDRKVLDQNLFSINSDIALCEQPYVALDCIAKKKTQADLTNSCLCVEFQLILSPKVNLFLVFYIVSPETPWRGTFAYFYPLNKHINTHMR